MQAECRQDWRIGDLTSSEETCSAEEIYREEGEEHEPGEVSDGCEEGVRDVSAGSYTTWSAALRFLLRIDILRSYLHRREFRYLRHFRLLEVRSNKSILADAIRGFLCSLGGTTIEAPRPRRAAIGSC